VARLSAPVLWPRFSSKDKKGRSSIGRASVSKTEGWGFEALRPCHLIQSEKVA
jgi:hypothetical protein